MSIERFGDSFTKDTCIGFFNPISRLFIRTSDFKTNDIAYKKFINGSEVFF